MLFNSKEANEVEVLILVNSYADYGVDPNYFTNYAFNIANPDHSNKKGAKKFTKILNERLLKYSSQILN